MKATVTDKATGRVIDEVNVWVENADAEATNGRVNSARQTLLFERPVAVAMGQSLEIDGTEVNLAHTVMVTKQARNASDS